MEKTLQQDLIYAYARTVEERLQNKNSGASILELRLKTIVDEHVLQDSNLMRALHTLGDVTYNAGAGRHEKATAHDYGQNKLLEDIYGTMQGKITAHLKAQFYDAAPEVRMALLDQIQETQEYCAQMEERFMDTALLDDDKDAYGPNDVNYQGFRHQRLVYQDLENNFIRQLKNGAQIENAPQR